MKTSHIPTTDNHSKNLTDEQCNDHLDNLQRIAGIKIADINLEESQNLLVFPQCFSESKDRIGSERIFELENNKLHTGNIMGFVGVNGSELKISSRFAQKDKPDYFLHYM